MLGYGMYHGAKLFTPEMKLGMYYIKMFVFVWIVFVTTIIAMKLDKIIKILESRKKGE